ncbi:hypothetical protein [Rappaport israeli]|uniref:hypothetical protein n=1 Tax=Rappaport israeli TaxID=1839807 RepID=UPI00098FF47B|nr:hypothetical protein [Rappaport israeli]
MASSLKKIYTHKINPDFIKQNIKQQAGYAAETISTARRNAESEINGNGIFASRSEDISGFGKNHNIVDIVETKNGEIIARSQQKFVTDTKALLRKIARGKGGGKTDFSRYLEVDYLDVPSEQVEEMKEFCQKEAKIFIQTS